MTTSMKRPAAFVVVLLLGAGTTAVCGRAGPRDMTIAGSTSLQPFAEKWADAYRAERSSPSPAQGSHVRRGSITRIHVQGGGSTAGVQAVLSGAAQIGLASRALTRDEAARVTGVQVARDGMAIIVHPTNRVKDLTLEELRNVYAGGTKSWRHVGGADTPITVITREEGSGTRAAFEDLVMTGLRISASALVQDSTGAVRQMVASDPAAIGYVSLGLVDASVRAVELDGVAPNERNIDAGTYPLVRPFLFVVPREPSPVVRDFIEWISGPAGRDLTRREGLLPPRA